MTTKPRTTHAIVVEDFGVHSTSILGPYPIAVAQKMAEDMKATGRAVEAVDEKSAVERGILVRPARITLTADQIAALHEFAAVNGHNWKSKLNHAWSTGRYRDYSGTEQDGLLQQIRNTFGPSWLVKFSFDNVKTHSIKR